MAHSLILGMTESGKTTLAKRLANAYRSRGFKIIVLDPLSDPEWCADFRTDDVEQFLNTFWNSRKCMAFIDEAGESVGTYDKVMIKTATKGRHWGHSVHFISQRGTQVARTVRDQCSHLFLFTTAMQDSKIHANEWNNPTLTQANLLQKGEYFHATRFGKLEKGELFKNE